MDADQIDKNCCEKTTEIGGQTFTKHNDPAKVQMILDNLAKEIFNKCFEYNILKCNESIKPPGEDHSNLKCFAMLDIFGFEDFQENSSNSIEQFCINYTNEKLQFLYMNVVFKREKEIFEKEGLSEFAKVITYASNEKILQLMDKKNNPPGIFNILKDKCDVEGKDGNDLYNAIDKAHKKSANYVPVRIHKPPRLGTFFRMEHSAKLVAYTCDEFIDKNFNFLPPDLQETVFGGKPTFVLVMKGKIRESDPDPEIDVQTNKYISTLFQADMANLYDT